VINKIDLPGANLPKVRAEIENVIGIPASEAIEISAKEGINIDQVMEAIVKRIPPPSGRPDAKLQALIFDSYYDEFRGVITKVCIKNGTVKKGDKVRMMATGNDFELSELGHLKVKMFPSETLSVGEVGYLVANIRSVDDSRVGDTVTLAHDPAPEPLPGYKKVLPMVYSGLFPVDADDFPKLRESLLKLQLNDAALSFEPESSSALGFGFQAEYRRHARSAFSHGHRGTGGGGRSDPSVRSRGFRQCRPHDHRAGRHLLHQRLRGARRRGRAHHRDRVERVPEPRLRPYRAGAQGQAHIRRAQSFRTGAYEVARVHLPQHRAGMIACPV
jgi:hypothetical protein